MPARPDIPSQLVADIYDAAIREDGLASIAESIGRHMGVRGSVVLLARGAEPPETYSSEVIREQNHLYMAYYHRLDPWRERGFMPGRDRICLASELFPETELVKTRFYTEFARPMGMFRPMSAYLDFGGGQMAALGVEEPFATRLFEPDDKARLQAVMPFVKRALRLRLEVGAARRKADLGFRALDALAVGVAVCAADGRIVHANAAAASLIEHGIGLGEEAGRVQAGSEEETARLLLLMREAGAGRPGSLVLRARDGRRIVVLVTPMPDGMEGGQEGGSGHVMLSLRVESAVPSPNPAVLRSLYGLSASQAQLCVALAAGKTFEECAAERNVSVATLRSHFAAVLTRTGAKNLRDLLRLLGILPALANAEA